MATYTVKSGDTLSQIAINYNTTVDALLKLNPSITNRDLIYTGQTITISGDAATAKKNTSNQAIITAFGIQSNTERTLFATWAFDRDYIDHYECKWYYATGDKTDAGSLIWFEASNDEPKAEIKYSILSSPPDNAKRVKFVVTPIAEKNSRGAARWKVSPSNEDDATYVFDLLTDTAPVPTVSINYDEMLLTAEVPISDFKMANAVQFYVTRTVGAKTEPFKTPDPSSIRYLDDGKPAVNYVRYTCYITAGGSYQVRARTALDESRGTWSAFSAPYDAPPVATTGIKVCKAASETSVLLSWEDVEGASSYKLEYAEKEEYFDVSDATTTISDIKTTSYLKTDLQTGKEYFFRLCAANEAGQSTWSKIVSVTIGTEPSAPTTWSSTTTCITGETLTLYWTHNAEDGSAQTWAEIEWYYGNESDSAIIDTHEQEDNEKTMHYDIDTSKFPEGTELQWRVRTAGVLRDETGAWKTGPFSTMRTVNIYTPPTLALTVTDKNAAVIETLTAFPLYVSATAGPTTQKPLSYHLTVIANDAYESVDNIGNVHYVRAGGEVYSKHFDTSERLLVELSAGDLDLQNNISYTVKCVVAMDSGLTAEESVSFKVSWQDVYYSPNAEIFINRVDLSADIYPYCKDNDGNLVEGVTMSVYRRDYDGSFTEIATGIDNLSNTHVTDPHPALDYARYRIVAMTNATGAVNYYDMPGIEVGEKGIIVQWSESWTGYRQTNEDALVSNPVHAGSILRLPYNIDISDVYSFDNSLVEYIGRKRPVGYYGTQIGETSTWKADIEKTNAEAVYLLRRLAMWPGDVYVREPSGTGYWANVKVTMNRNHLEVTIPVTLTVTRVEGGA